MMLKLKSAQMLRTSSTLRHFSNKYPKPGRPYNLDKKTDEEGYWKRGRVPDYSFEKPKGILQQVSEFFGFGNQNSSEKKPPSQFTNVEFDQKLRFGSTLPKDSTSQMHCSWATTDLESFKKQIDSKGTPMNLIAVDWLKSDRVLRDISSSPGGIVQRYSDEGLPEFFIVFNIQGPGASKLHLILYYAMKAPVGGLLQRFINGDDEFRTSCLYFCSHAHAGNKYLLSWVPDVGPVRVGEKFRISYVRGKNYLEIGIDVSSYTPAASLASNVYYTIYYLVVDAIIKDIKQTELPLIGTARLMRLNTNKAVNIEVVG